MVTSYCSFNNTIAMDKGENYWKLYDLDENLVREIVIEEKNGADNKEDSGYDNVGSSASTLSKSSDSESYSSELFRIGIDC